MGGGSAALTGPDFASGVAVSEVREGRPLLGHAQGEAVLLVRHGEGLFAVAATCPHYGGPLAEGLQVGGSVRCPWHHASFEVATGAPSAPAINPLGCFSVQVEDGRARVVGKREPKPPAPKAGPASVVIIGGGAAGHAAAETLRREGYEGPVTVLSSDASEPYDRPNLSKDYLAGTAPEEWIPLRSRADYSERRIELRTSTRVAMIDPATRTVTLEDGSTLGYGALLLATGATPRRLSVPGASAPHVHVLRSLADARAIIEGAKTARTAVVVGASFIGLEVAASLRARGVEVQVVGLEAVPMERIFGAEAGAFVQQLHESNGVTFHLRAEVASIDPQRGVTLNNGKTLPAELVVVGVGVQPEVSLAQIAGLETGNGVVTNEFLETSAAGIWAAGDLASWRDLRTGEHRRVEHWIVAQRQGAIAARNILGERVPFTAVPFFWSVQHGVAMSYVGHGAGWDSTELDGSFAGRSFILRYRKGGELVAALCVGRDAECLQLEVELERRR